MQAVNVSQSVYEGYANGTILGGYFAVSRAIQEGQLMRFYEHDGEARTGEYTDGVVESVVPSSDLTGTTFVRWRLEAPRETGGLLSRANDDKVGVTNIP